MGIALNGSSTIWFPFIFGWCPHPWLIVFDSGPPQKLEIMEKQTYDLWIGSNFSSFLGGRLAVTSEIIQSYSDSDRNTYVLTDVYNYQGFVTSNQIWIVNFLCSGQERKNAPHDWTLAEKIIRSSGWGLGSGIIGNLHWGYKIYTIAWWLWWLWWFRQHWHCWFRNFEKWFYGFDGRPLTSINIHQHPSRPGPVFFFGNLLAWGPHHMLWQEYLQCVMRVSFTHRMLILRLFCDLTI